MFSFVTHRKRRDIFYSGLKFSLIEISHSVKFKILFLLNSVVQVHCDVKIQRNCNSRIFWAQCHYPYSFYMLNKKFQACLATYMYVYISMYTYTYNWFLLRFFAHTISNFVAYFVGSTSIKFLRWTWMVKTYVHSGKIHTGSLTFLLKFGSMECF